MRETLSAISLIVTVFTFECQLFSISTFFLFVQFMQDNAMATLIGKEVYMLCPGGLRTSEQGQRLV